MTSRTIAMGAFLLWLAAPVAAQEPTTVLLGNDNNLHEVNFSQFQFVPANVENACPTDHFHAAFGGFVTANDGFTIPDPDPPVSCGFGNLVFFGPEGPFLSPESLQVVVGDGTDRLDLFSTPGGFKIGENSSPLPRDRMFVNFNYFADANPRGPQGDFVNGLYRELLGRAGPDSPLGGVSISDQGARNELVNGFYQQYLNRPFSGNLTVDAVGGNDQIDIVPGTLFGRLQLGTGEEIQDSSDGGGLRQDSKPKTPGTTPKDDPKAKEDEARYPMTRVLEKLVEKLGKAANLPIYGEDAKDLGKLVKDVLDGVKGGKSIEDATKDAGEKNKGTVDKLKNSKDAQKFHDDARKQAEQDAKKTDPRDQAKARQQLRALDALKGLMGWK